VDAAEGLWIDGAWWDPADLRAALGAWLPPADLLDEYHAFFSYRQGPADSATVLRLFDVLSAQAVGPDRQPVELFWDQAWAAMRSERGRC
jgi:hypothetical protein